MANSFSARRDRLLNATVELQTLAIQKNNSFAAELLTENIRRLKQESFTLVIAGEFKRGKSTLINALLGRDLLPTAIVPLTAIPTIIQHGGKPTARVVFLDHTESTVEIKEIALYVTERHNPRNVKQVQAVYLTCPSPFLAQGVVLVDTPGVGSAYTHNTKTAYSYLPLADAAIFLTSVEAPLSKAELDYLKDVYSYVNRVFFILNKIDLVDPADLAEALEFSHNLLQETLPGQKIALFPLAARQALQGKLHRDFRKITQSGLNHFEQELNNFLITTKGKLILEAAARRSWRIISELELGLNILQHALESDLAGLKEKTTRFQAELQQLTQEREEHLHLLYREVDRLNNLISTDLAAFQKAVLPEFLAALEQFVREQQQAQVSNRDLAQNLNTFICDLIQSGLQQWRKEEWYKIQEEFTVISTRFFQRIEDINARMMTISAEIFEVPFTRIPIPDLVLENKRFYFHFETGAGLIPSLNELPGSSLIPRNLMLRYLQKTARNKLTELLDRNCGRVRYDLTEGLKENVQAVAKDLRRRTDTLRQSLQEALHQAIHIQEHHETTQRTAQSTWDRELTTLQEIKKEITPLIRDEFLYPQSGRQ
ncbi:MAG: dynamin family protein [Heliobacteriaceae bacterium]|nr:dynamin family protein [Heliobacteriaceae bacterium]